MAFKPYEVESNDYVGTILRIRAIGATIPEDLLPPSVALAATWVRIAGATLKSWYATHDYGMITLPTVPGDGSQDLRQLIDWLESRGYRRTTAADDPEIVYSRTAA